MRRLDAIVFSSILGAAACATQVPLDLHGLDGFSDGAVTYGQDSGAGGFGNGGFPEVGGFPTGSGGMPFGMGGAPILMGSGGRPLGSGGRMMPPPGNGGAPMLGTGGVPRGSGGATPPPGGAPAGSGGAPNCRSTEKLCGGVCVSPAPKTGCSLTGCEPCTNTAPANGVVICSNNQCDFSCLSGFTKSGNMCQGPPPGSGGSTGGGGPAASCGGQSCPSCSVILGPSCCTSAGKCGCPLIPWTAGFLGCL